MVNNYKNNIQIVFLINFFFENLIGFRKELQELNEKDAARFLKEGKLYVNGFELTDQHLLVKYVPKKESLSENVELGGESEIKILLDVSQDEDMKLKGVAREIVNRIQKLRKKAKLNLDDEIVIFIEYENEAQLIHSVIESKRDFIEVILRKPFQTIKNKPWYFETIEKEEFDYEDEKFSITISKTHIVLNKDKIEVKRVLT